MAIYGGVSGVAYDPCYHQACDTFINVNERVFKQMADGAATALLTFGFTKKPVTATTSRKASRRVSRKVAKQRMARATFRGPTAQR